MDPRESTNALVRRIGRGLCRLNARHPWSHNEHFHPWILRHLPPGRRAALDVGCGSGVLLGALAPRFGRVVAIDADATMAARAASRFAGHEQVTVRRATLAEFASEGHAGEFDAVTLVAVLHHLELERALQTLRGLVAPGGRLLVVGLAKVTSASDLAIDLVSAVANPLVGLWKHPAPLRVPAPPHDPEMPVRDPGESFAQIRDAACRLLPGARVRRRLFFRYTLEWTRHMAEPSAPVM